MKNNNIKIINLILICIFTFLIILPSESYCTDLGLDDLNTYIGEPKASSELTNRIGSIFGIVQTVGMVVSIAMLVVIGIKYMVGSIEEKAEYKKTLWPYILGAFLLFTGTLVPQIIYNIVTKLG